MSGTTDAVLLDLIVANYGDDADTLLTKLDEFQGEVWRDTRSRLLARALAHAVKHNNYSAFALRAAMVYNDAHN